MVGVYSDGTGNSQWYFDEIQPKIAYTIDNKVEITFLDEDATIYYTTDGSEPPTSGDEHKYSAPFLIEDDDVTIIKAVAVVGGIVTEA